MARIRTIKPGFFTSEDVAALSIRGRLTWIGLWTHADDYGRAKANPRLIKAALYPLDDDISILDVLGDLGELEAAGRIRRYEVDGAEYLQVNGWENHQRIARPTPSRIPNADALENNADALETIPGREGKGREGRGNARADARRPAPFCSFHPQGTERPCQGCANARRAHDAWTPTAPAMPSVDEALNPELDEHGFPVGRCPVCRKGAA